MSTHATPMPSRAFPVFFRCSFEVNSQRNIIIIPSQKRRGITKNGNVNRVMLPMSEASTMLNVSVIAFYRLWRPRRKEARFRVRG